MKSTASSNRLVLLVEPDAEEREEFGSWLEGAGYGVIECPGPPGAGMICLGQRGQACGLVEISDLLVLNLQTIRDAFQEKTPGRRLLHYYLSAGKPVLLLGDPASAGKRYRDDQVAVLQRRGKISRRRFLQAISRLEGAA